MTISSWENLHYSTKRPSASRLLRIDNKNDVSYPNVSVLFKQLLSFSKHWQKFSQPTSPDVFHEFLYTYPAFNWATIYVVN
ncbi:hypothetical protein DPMN_077290 [Dreissena polymorpha]|uniref:Uncharacterized protein n=1 Tax=Dreissena polymorpha TaxID=45954 RepID=A0A9D3YP03_DREPO|nr:hypothetical protein DPMN_077290 [Dreissena polymorpha]